MLQHATTTPVLRTPIVTAGDVVRVSRVVEEAASVGRTGETTQVATAIVLQKVVREGGQAGQGSVARGSHLSIRLMLLCILSGQAVHVAGID